MKCSLGLECVQMGLDESGECINEELCHEYTKAWDLYDIVLLKGFPGAVYICWHSRDASTEWTEEKWGFKYLNNSTWLLHHSAPLNEFKEWQRAYHKLSGKNSKYVRSNLFDEFEALRRQVDLDYGKRQEDSALILF